MNRNDKNECVEFGKFLRKARLERGISARDVAEAVNMLPSNFSKLEHGALMPPKDNARLRAMASAISIQASSEEEGQFFDKAAKATNSVPVDLAEIISRDDAMPLLLRTIGNKRLTRAEIDRLIAIVRGENDKSSDVQQ